MFTESHRKPSLAADVPPSAAGGINNMSKWTDLDFTPKSLVLFFSSSPNFDSRL